MLRQRETFRLYPSCSIVRDLITRNGPPDENSYTPFMGRHYLIAEQFTGNNMYSFDEGLFIDWIESSYELDLSKVKPTIPGNKLTAATEKGMFKRLEECIIDGAEIPEISVYIRSQLIGYKINNTSPGYVRRELTYTSIDEEGVSTPESQLLIKESKGSSIEEYNEAALKMPYVIRSIWNMSKKYRVNLFSFALAYIDLTRTKGKRNVTVTDFRNYSTYLINTDGTYVRPFVHEKDNKQEIYPNALRLFTAPGSYPELHDLVSTYANYLNILGINYKDERALEYTNEWINSLVCNYIPKNDEYIATYKNMDVEVATALESSRILTTTKDEIYSRRYYSNNNTADSEFLNIITERIYLVATAGVSSSGRPVDMADFTSNDSSLKCKDIIEHLCLCMGRQANRSLTIDMLDKTKLRDDIDYFIYYNGEPWAFQAGFLDNDLADKLCLITCFGLVVVVDRNLDYNVRYMPYTSVIALMEEYIKYGTVQSKADWKYI